MTTRNFDALFKPRSIALIGASNQPNSVGALLARNLLNGGFKGPLMPVNPHETAIRSTLCYRSVAGLPITPDLAIIATPPATVPGLVSELGQRGCRAAIVITAGFEDTDSTLRQDMLNAARPHLLRIVGPNCLGFLSPAIGINASFAHLAPAAGDIAFVTQSGAIATTMLDWAAERNVGFSHVLSLGDMSDVDFGDALDYLALDPSTSAILLYVEMITHARKFMSAARIAARAKPVIVVKAGRSQAGARAALSHTGALAGSDDVYDAAFRRAGLLRVDELRDLFDAANTLSTGVRVDGDRLTILTNGGGLGVLAADALEQQGGHLADLPETVQAKLNAVLPKTWSHRNPIDILGDANGARYTSALEAVLSEPDQDAILVMNCPTGVVDALDAADAVLTAAQRHKDVPIITCWVGQATADAPRHRFSAGKVPTFETPNDAVRAFIHLNKYRRNQELLLETPRSETTVPAAAKDTSGKIIKAALAEQRSVLTAPEAKALLAAYGIPVVNPMLARDTADAAELARNIVGPIALKILSPDITHKSDAGGVRLNLQAGEVESAARKMLETVAKKAPKARITGFTVEPMIDRERSHELIVGMSVDPTFGPVLMFGQGGVAVEVLHDSAMGLPPLNSVLALEMISRTRVAKLLEGYRNIPPANLDAVVAALLTLSELVIQSPEITEIDINPLLANETGVTALDARIVVKALKEGADQRLAIRPYPVELEHEIELASGRRLQLRPIRPQDQPALSEMVERSTPQDRRLRFLGAVNVLPRQLAGRLSQIDYDREMALVAVDPADAGCILGVARLVSDPDFETAEYAVMVRSDLKGQGIGYRLMEEILSYATSRGIGRVFGEVIASNSVMITMARELGAVITPAGGAAGLIHVVFNLANREIDQDHGTTLSSTHDAAISRRALRAGERP